MANVKKLIIFEEPQHAEEISRLQTRDEDVIVCFSAPAKLALDKKGIKCYLPDDLIELPDLNEIGIADIERVQKICDFIDTKLREEFVFLRENNLNIFSASYHIVKIFFDMLYSNYFILTKLFGKLKVGEVIIFKKTHSLDKFLHGKAPIVEALIENVFAKTCINIKIIVGKKLDFRNLSMSRLKDFVNDMRNSILIKNNRRKCGSAGIVLGNTHDIPYVINGILRDIDFYKPYFNKHSMVFRMLRSFNSGIRLKYNRREKHYKDAIRKIFGEALSSESYRDIFINNNALFYFANKCLENYVSETLGHILPHADYIKELLIHLNPRILLTSLCRLELQDAFILELAKSLNIPIVTYQEGGCAGYLNWPLFDLDTKLSDYFLVYGKGVKESPFLTGKARVIPVGSVRLDSIKKNMKTNLLSQATIYVILDAFKINTWQHYPYNGGFFSQAYSHQLLLIKIMRQFPTVKFVLKPLKGRKFLYEPFINKKNTKIVTKPLASVLNDANAFILDCPSTTLQECLLTDKPIALLSNPRAFCFDSKALEMLSRRVRICLNPEQFYEVIGALIKDVRHEIGMAGEDEFLKNYCLMENTSKNLEMFFNELFKNSNAKGQPINLLRKIYVEQS